MPEHCNFSLFVFVLYFVRHKSLSGEGPRGQRPQPGVITDLTHLGSRTIGLPFVLRSQATSTQRLYHRKAWQESEPRGRIIKKTGKVQDEPAGKALQGESFHTCTPLQQNCLQWEEVNFILWACHQMRGSWRANKGRTNMMGKSGDQIRSNWRVSLWFSIHTVSWIVSTLIRTKERREQSMVSSTSSMAFCWTGML